MENLLAPVRYHYHLRLSSRRGLNLSPQQYHQLKTIGLIIDLKQFKKRDGNYEVVQQDTVLNKQLSNICTAAERNIDKFGNSEAVIMVLDKFQTYVHPDVARQLRSLLGIMIKRNALAN